MCYEYVVQYNCVVALAHNIITSKYCGCVSTIRETDNYTIFVGGRGLK